ncbi:MAG: PASTA domain-containing protein [Polyangiales bacterium]
MGGGAGAVGTRGRALGTAGKAFALLVSGAAFAGIAYVGGTARSESVALAPDSSAVRVSPSRAAGAAPIDLDLAGPVIASVASVAPEDTYEPPAGTVLVPEVKRMRVADARVLLESYGLRVSVRDTSGESVGRSEERFFRVRTQSPRLNERVPEGAVVQLRARPVGGYGQGY